MYRAGAVILCGALLLGRPAFAQPEVAEPEWRNPVPSYPVRSLQLGEQGTVTLRVLVEADGRPSKIEVGQSSGYERLDKAAIRAVEQWRFLPAKKDGEPISSWAIIPMPFVIQGLPKP